MGKFQLVEPERGMFFISLIDEYKLDDYVQDTIDKVFVVIDTIRDINIYGECYCFRVD